MAKYAVDITKESLINNADKDTLGILLDEFDTVINYRDETGKRLRYQMSGQPLADALYGKVMEDKITRQKLLKVAHNYLIKHVYNPNIYPSLPYIDKLLNDIRSVVDEITDERLFKLTNKFMVLPNFVKWCNNGLLPTIPTIHYEDEPNFIMGPYQLVGYVRDTYRDRISIGQEFYLHATLGESYLYVSESNERMDGHLFVLDGGRLSTFFDANVIIKV